jgi:uncharacterized membrane protein
MNRWQKIAWFTLVITVICFIICLLLAIAMQWRVAIPPTPLSLVIIPWLVLVAISKVIFRKKIKRVDFDERDRQIHNNAHYVGLWAFVLSITAALTIEAMICFIAAGPGATLGHPLILLLTICAGGGAWIAAESVAILIHYSRGDKNA